MDKLLIFGGVMVVISAFLAVYAHFKAKKPKQSCPKTPNLA
ncbi:MAG: hypothetical protein ACTTH5_07505 [Wolinella sp.]